MTDDRKDQRVPVMMAQAEVARLDQWRSSQSDLPTRSEAVRRLVAATLSEQKSGPWGSWRYWPEGRRLVAIDPATGLSRLDLEISVENLRGDAEIAVPRLTRAGATKDEIRDFKMAFADLVAWVETNKSLPWDLRYRPSSSMTI